MLKPINIKYKGREISLECTHKQVFPPPQMYGSTPEDIDNLWKQGTIDQNQYQHLKTWQEKCGLMVMGPKCLDCPLALKRTPRPGRPNVVRTSNWLEAKRQMHWDDMKTDTTPEKDGHVKLRAPVDKEEPDEVVEERVEEMGAIPWTDKEIVGFKNVDTPELEPEPETEDSSLEEIFASDEPEAEEEDDDDAENDIINALADD